VISIRRVSLLLTSLLVLATPSLVAAADTYVEDGIKSAGRQHVIITVTPGHESEVIDALRKHGGSVKSQHPSINGVAADIDGADVLDLATHGAVAITRDHTVNISATTAASRETTARFAANAPQPISVSTLRLSLGLKAGAASNLNPGMVNGTGVGVAIIDSGIAPSADFGNPIRFFDFTQLTSVGGPTTPPAYDDLGHGTHIAGLIASTGAAPGYMFQGIAPKASLVVLKVLDKNGAGSTSTVIAAIEYVVKNQKTLGVQVVNLSLGHPITAPARFDPLVQAVEDAARHNLIVVIAAGNDGPGYASVNSPGNSPSAITVGAVDGKTTVTLADDYVPSFSSRGPTWYDGFAKPDVSAPGVNLFSDAAPNSTLVKSTSPAYPQETIDGMKLLDLSGTSMAAAVATGVVALELDANSHQTSAPLTPNAAKAILEYTAIKLAQTDALTQGAGQINAAGAVQLAGAINTLAPTGSWWLQTGVTGSSVIGGKSYAWAQNIIWGTSVIGGRFIYYKNLAWDDNIIWGTGVVRGNRLIGSRRIEVRGKFYNDNIIWGTDFTVKRKSVVWGKGDGDNIIWGTDAGDNIIWGTNLAQYRILGQHRGNKIIWAKDDADNIIWGTDAGDNIIWGTDDGDNIIWGTWSGDGDNIIWGTTADDNIIWGTSGGDNIIWGTSAADDNIIWGTSASLSKVVTGKQGSKIIWAVGDSDNIIWGTADADNIIWGTSDDNIIWGTDGDNIIWGTSAGEGQ
jgi:serine protease AprX